MTASPRAVKRAVPCDQAHRLLNTGATVLVSSSHGPRRSVLTVAWQMPASLDPPLLVVSIGLGRFSHRVIRRAREFVVNIPTASELPLVRNAGMISGRKRDKFEGLGLTAEPAATVSVPRVAECPGHLECRLARTHRCGDHTLFVGEVVGVFATEEFFEERLRIEAGAQTLHHLSGSEFHLPGTIVRM